MLKSRIITAVILIPLVLIILFFAPFLLFACLSLIMIVAGAWEWTTLAGYKALSSRVGYSLTTLIVCIGFLFLPAIWILSLALLYWLFASYLVLSYPRSSRIWNHSCILKGAMGMLVLAFCWIGLLVIRQHSQGIHYLLLVLFSVWAADTGAYFAGRWWGKHKLAPAVSPGKTWEGVIGGLLLSLIVAWLGSIGLQLPATIWLIASIWLILTVVASVFGDLFESMMKRQAGVKDSGNLLPGHGGILDRIDSLTAALPLFALGMLLISQ